MEKENKLTYKEAGVDIEAGYEAVKKMKAHVKTTMRPEVIGGLGGFGGLFALDTTKYKQPVLVSGTDGVGTKLKIAFMMDQHDTIGIDAVAMCVNDIVVQGAEPLFFLDYIGVGKLVPDQVAEVVKGVAEGCRQAGCALIGGETAEMPGLYTIGDYDIAGFSVGVVERDGIITGEDIKPGDAIIGLASNGIHSNGYSLVRRILFDAGHYNWKDEINVLGSTLGAEIIKPTRIYVKSILSICESFDIKGIAHITGGGLPENVARILPEAANAMIKKGSWQILPIFSFMQETGHIEEAEMFKTFNMGIGMTLVVNPQEVDALMQKLVELGETPYVIGEITEGNGTVKII